MKEGNVKYYLDENKDYVVPKRRLEDMVKYDKFSCSANKKHV